MIKTIIIVLFILTTLPSFAHKDKWDDYKDGWSPLMIAIYYGQTDKFIQLIKHNVDVNYISPGSNKFWRRTALEVAIRKGNLSAVKALLSTNKIKHPTTYLMTACGEKSALPVELLIKHGANPNEKLENGYSVTMMAADFGSFEVLECLLKHGVNLKQTRKTDGMTILMFAVLSGNPKKVKLLLDNGANKYAKDLNKETAFNYVDHIYDETISEKTKSELRKLLKVNVIDNHSFIKSKK